MSSQLTLPTKLWYALGQGAEGLKNGAYSLFLLFYYTSVIGLSGNLAGQAILIALLFDAVTDPLVGVYSDQLQSRHGRRHPLLFASAIPLPIFFYLTFAPPPDLTQMQLFFWLTTFTILTRAAMTLFHVPHLALGAELSTDYEERSQIVSLQNLLNRIGSDTAGGLGLLLFLAPTAMHADGRFNAEAYPPMAFTIAILIFVCVLLSAWNTRSRIPHLPQPDPSTIDRHPLVAMLASFREVLAMPSFRRVFVGTLFLFIAWGVSTSLGLHTATYFWQVSTTEMVFWGLGTGAGIFCGLVFWLRRANATDKMPVFVQGGMLYTLALSGPMLLRVNDLWPDRDSSLYLPMWIIVTGFVAHFGVAATMVTGRSMIADVVDEDELNTGKRREGIFFGASSLAAKALFGFGSLIAGWVFDAVGLRQGMTVADMPPGVSDDLGLATALSILLLVGTGVAVISRYPLNRERCAEIRNRLDGPRADQPASEA